MRKLVFMLKVNNPNSATPHNLDISTHKGARLRIVGNHATVLDVTDDEMTDSELQSWYRSRYSGMGMGIKILYDNDTVVSPVVEKIEKSISVKDESPVEVKPKRTRKTKKVKEAETVEDSVNVQEASTVAKVESKLEPKVNIDIVDVSEIKVSTPVSVDVNVSEVAVKPEAESISVVDNVDNVEKAETNSAGDDFSNLQSYLW